MRDNFVKRAFFTDPVIFEVDNPQRALFKSLTNARKIEI